MSKPGEMVQLLRDNYEEQIEAYRLLRNKFLIAVPGMNLDREKQLYDQWKLDLHLNSIIDFERNKKPPEPRTCETCEHGERMARSYHYECMIEDPDTLPNPSCPDKCAHWKSKQPASHRHVSAEDVETVRNCIRSLITQLCAYRWSEKDDDIAAGHGVPKAIDVLDRIAGKEESR